MRYTMNEQREGNTPLSGAGRSRGFSLIELVIVVVIIAIIGAIAIPRLSRGAAGAADSALIGNLRVLRSAVDLYASEHGGTFPTLAAMNPSGTPAVSSLTSFSDDQGNLSATKTTTFIYGPYLRAIPALPVGGNKAQTLFTATAPGATASSGSGWFYDATTGSIKPNTTDAEKDAKGVAYNTY